MADGESARPHAGLMSIVQADNPTIRVQKCLEALKQVFGSLESRRSSQVRYLKTYQQEGEGLGVCVTVGDPTTEALKKDAIPRGIADQGRLEQVMAGARLSQVLWCRFQELKEEGPPPSFLELIKIIREEEEEASFTRETIEEQDRGSGYGHWENKQEI